MNRITIEVDNTQLVLNALDSAVNRALEKIGQQAETNTKSIIQKKHIIGTPESTKKKGYRGGTLLRSITHQVDKENKSVSIGSNVEYAPYVELGTGPHFTPPPEWEQFESKRGKGIGHGYVKPRPYLRPAIENNVSQYMQTFKQELEKG